MLRTMAPLTEDEMAMARIAWKYFENNTRPETGLANAVNNYPSTTTWDTASYLGGLVAAFELGIVEKPEFDQRLKKLLQTFRKIDLFRGQVPNKAYHTKTGAKVDYTNKPGEIGYSALDLGRLMIWFHIIKHRYPEHGNAIDRVVLRWNFCHVIDKNGTLFGTAIKKEDNSIIYLQEGRLGYEEYSAKGFQLWGFDTTRASKFEPYDVMPIFGIDVPYDVRDPRSLGAHNYVVAESYVLNGIEFNWDHSLDRSTDHDHHSEAKLAEFADRIYRVQEARYRMTGIVTARTEHQLDRAPYFVYDTIYTSGYAWNTITDKGEFVPEFAAIALKGAMGIWALWDTDYTDLLFSVSSTAYDPEKGFYEGIFENGKGFINTFTANNNGIILESLLYKTQGKLLKWSDHPSIWEETTKDEFADSSKCRPRVEAL